LLKRIDEAANPDLLWKKVRNLVSELHWKVSSFLIENYDTILLPDFRTGKMIKGKKLSLTTRRLLSMFSFHKFKLRLKHKCSMYGKNLIIVDESYTSCTCGVCGEITRTKKEVFRCRSCGLELDRDVAASRNIFIKNITLNKPDAEVNS
jgi:putative transposase